MRALSYIIALVVVLTGRSLAGSNDHNMPGAGIFTCCGTPIATPRARDFWPQVGQ